MMDFEDKVAKAAESVRDAETDKEFSLGRMERVTDADYPAVTPLIEEFWEDQEVFDNWVGDALVDQEPVKMACIQSKGSYIRLLQRHIDAKSGRGDIAGALDTQVKLEHEYREMGKMMFNHINEYMEKASERCA